MSALPPATRTKITAAPCRPNRLCNSRWSSEQAAAMFKASSAALQTLQDIALRGIVQRALAIETQSVNPGACAAASSPNAPVFSLATAQAVCMSCLFGSSIGMGQAPAMRPSRAECGVADVYSQVFWWTGIDIFYRQNFAVVARVFRCTIHQGASAEALSQASYAQGEVCVQHQHLLPSRNTRLNL